MHNRRDILRTFAALVAASSVFPYAAQAQEEAKTLVVATFSILGDFVRIVGGPRIALTTIVGPNADAHVYNPTPADAKNVAAARILFKNGFGLEGWLDRLLQSSATMANIGNATDGITPLLNNGQPDPHAWQNVAKAKLYVDNIRDGLSIADPLGMAEYARRAEAYQSELNALDNEIRAGISAIPPARRRIVTTHDAFAYFAEAYGLTFLAPAGVSTEGEISASNVAAVIKQIRAEKIPAVFLENMTDQRMIDQIAKESGAKIGGVLFADSLSPPDGPAPNYLAMMRYNVKQLTAALT